jgi:hypothetical protein
MARSFFRGQPHEVSCLDGYVLAVDSAAVRNQRYHGKLVVLSAFVCITLYLLSPPTICMQFYAPTIFEKFFGSKGGIYGSMALNIVNFFATFITIATVERFGRVKLLFTGAILMCASLIPNSILSGIEQTDAVGTW